MTHNGKNTKIGNTSYPFQSFHITMIYILSCWEEESQGKGGKKIKKKKKENGEVYNNSYYFFAIPKKILHLNSDLPQIFIW